MISCLIVDDEPLSRQVIARLLASHGGFEVRGEAGDGQDALQLIERVRPDVVFLDVQMPGMDGLEVLRELDERRLPAIVFVTAYGHYAVKAFEQRAVDYLLKPVEEARFAETIARLREAVNGGGEQWVSRLRELMRDVKPVEYRRRVIVRERERIFFVEVADIDWFEAAANYVRIHCGAATHMIRSTMSQLESTLDPRFFVRIHRSSIVNVGRVVELQPFFRGTFVAVLKSGARLEVQRAYRDQLLEAFENPGPSSVR